MSISSPISLFGIDRRRPPAHALLKVDSPARPPALPADPWAACEGLPFVVEGFAEGEIDSDRLARLHAYWQGRKNGRRLPRRADIDILDLKFCIGNLMLVDGDAGDGIPGYRVYGTALAATLGADLTGQLVGSGPGTDPYRQTLAKGVPAYCITQLCGETLGQETPGQFWERLVLPLSPDGERVTQLLVCALPLIRGPVS